MVVSEPVETSAAINTGIVGAVIRVEEAVPALIAKRTLTCVASVEVDTSRSVLAGLGGGALVNVHLTPGALVAQGAGAGVALVVAVGRAGGAIVAWVGGTGIHFSLASLPIKWRVTNAEEIVDSVDAGATILAGAVDAVVNVDLAVLSSEAWLTDALVGAELVVAFAAMLARVGVTLINLFVARGTAPARRTVTDEPRDVIFTVTSDTGVVATLVNVSLTSFPKPAGLTCALVVIDEVDTLASVLARAVQTLINVLLAQAASVARLAPALEPVDLVHALALVQARVAGTLVHIDLTVVSVCSGQTVALVTSAQSSLASASVMTRIDIALVDFLVAKSPGIARIAMTREIIDAIDTTAVETVIVDTLVVVDFTPAS